MRSLQSLWWHGCLRPHRWLGYLWRVNKWYLSPAGGWTQWCICRWNPSPTRRRRRWNMSPISICLCMARLNMSLQNLALLPLYRCMLCNPFMPRSVVSIRNNACYRTRQLVQAIIQSRKEKKNRLIIYGDASPGIMGIQTLRNFRDASPKFSATLKGSQWWYADHQTTKIMVWSLF